MRSKYFIGSEEDEEGSCKSVNTRGEDIDTERCVPAGTCVLEPFLYLYTSQPHTVVSCGYEAQKFEMSCYDILVKASDTPYIPLG